MNALYDDGSMNIFQRTVISLRLIKSALYASWLRSTPRGRALQAVREKSAYDPEHPVFSVVIPVYDRTKELIAAIESVLAQRFRNLELLLVCDGSPPATKEIVKKYADHPQVRTYFYPDNSGNACRGRNKAIAMAKGQYIALPERLGPTLSSDWQRVSVQCSIL